MKLIRNSILNVRGTAVSAFTAISLIIGILTGCLATQQREPIFDPLIGAQEAVQRYTNVKSLVEMSAVMTNESAAAVGCEIAPMVASMVNLVPFPEAKAIWVKFQRRYALPETEENIMEVMAGTVNIAILSEKDERELTSAEKAKLEKKIAERAAKCGLWTARCKTLIPSGREFLNDLDKLTARLEKLGVKFDFTGGELRKIDINNLTFTVVSSSKVEITGPGLEPPKWEARFKDGKWWIHSKDCGSIECFWGEY